ncbi:hypothetical protein FQR65_LT04465 [Abscondita terminalis]|nr:hypothetical protein FQR65_LT04465 [Abscondita terminalis]
MLGTSISFPHCWEELPAHYIQVQKRQSSTELRSVNTAMATCYPSYELSTQTSRTVQVPVQKDYSRPLHVDCSVEYELPNQAKPPQGQLWEPMPPLIPISAAAAVQQTYCGKRDAAAAAMVSGCATYSSGSGDSGHWTDPDRSPDRPEDKHILSGKYRQYLRAHRLHPYVSSAIPIASTFPQIQQVCYNV